MKVKLSSVAVLTICLLFLASGAFADSIPVANPSFETPPPPPGYNNFCGGGCEYTTGVPIPGWVTTGYDTGQWIPASYHGNYAYNGITLAYTCLGSPGGGTDCGTISQDVLTKAVAGHTYTLTVEILHRFDVPMGGVAQLTLNGAPVAMATGGDLGVGSWNKYTAHFTATGAEAGQELGILLSSNGLGQGDFDYVQMSAVPERSNLAMLLGFGIFNLAAVLSFRRKLV
jgi:hypothetical protein